MEAEADRILSGRRSRREIAAYDAGRLAGYEEGIEAASAAILDVERLAKALALTYGIVDREMAADIARHYQQLTVDPDGTWGPSTVLRPR